MRKFGFFKNIFFTAAAATVAITLGGCSLFNGGGNNSVPPAVYLSQEVIEVEEGKTVQLAAASTDNSPVIWVSGDEDVATVSQNGLVTAISAGTSLITATTDTAMATCTVKVTKSVELPAPAPDTETLVLTLQDLKLEVGESTTLKAISSAGEAITWTSSEPKVASVTGGVVKALSKGSTVISAVTESAIAQCNVTVTDLTEGDAAKDGYRLVWRDEFNGTSLDTSKWGYQTGTCDQYGSFIGSEHNVNYWGNNELQYYTKDAVSVADGALKITAKRQNMGDRTYTSGRILTRDLATWTYGYFEAKIKTPTGNGMWPAFWMLPQPSNPNSIENSYGGWPANGEIDIMEAKGRLNNVVDTTLHFGKAWDAHEYVTKETALSSNTDEWHTYAVDWTANAITWYVDGQSVMTVTKDRWWSQDASNKGQSMPFDKPFYILLNLAVGGQYDSYHEPDASFTSASMYVDYVRVYEKI